MSEPEIARRCAACGASIRERAFFCPECGKSLVDRTETSASAPTEAISNSHPGIVSDPEQQLPQSSSEEPTHQAQLQETVTTPVQLSEQRNEEAPPNVGEPKFEPSPASPVITAPLRSPRPDYAHPRLHRAAAGAKEAFEDGAQRVERLRKISSVVIDQASYDPSLRFILVAAGFFLVFIAILIISKLIG